MRRVYEINFTLEVQEFIEAESREEALQEFSELYSTDDLLDYGVVTIAETDEVASDE